jgi:ADP-heptose:LPS heptosyltransferase
MSNLVAVFQIGSLGDSIVSVPTLLSIRELLPDCSEYLLVSGFYSKMKVSPSDIFKMAWKPKKHLEYAGPENRLHQLWSVPSVLAKLRYYKPRYCVSLMPADREPYRIERDRRFFRAAGIKELLGFEPYPASMFTLSSATSVEGTEAYQRFQRLWGEASAEKFATYARVPILQPSDNAVRKADQWLMQQRKHPGKRLIAISPYSNFPSRDIPDQTIAELVSGLTKDADAEIVMVGGHKDAVRAAKILGSDGLNACGEFSVQESAALLKACSLAICTESGPMHLASAVGVPLLATFSRINVQLARWLPFGQRSTILYREVPCAGCIAVNCPVAGHPCMEKIKADQILSAAMSILNGLPVVGDAFDGTKVLHW